MKSLKCMNIWWKQLNLYTKNLSKDKNVLVYCENANQNQQLYVLHF